MDIRTINWTLTEYSPQLFLVEYHSQSPETQTEVDNVFRWDELFENLPARVVVILDFESLEVFTSALLASMLTTHRKLEKLDSQIVLCNLSEYGRQFFRIAKIYRRWDILFNYCESREEAKAKARLLARVEGAEGE